MRGPAFASSSFESRRQGPQAKEYDGWPLEAGKIRKQILSETYRHEWSLLAS